MSGPELSLPSPAIAPSILTADFGRLREQIQEAESAGVDLIHLDIMDGHFVPNISFGPLVVSAVRNMTELPLDVHLMIDAPERYVDTFAEAGADIITIQVEATVHPHRTLQQISRAGIASGIALNPGTPLVAIEELLSMVDLVLVMSVNPGFGGQTFIPESLDKIRRLKTILADRDINDVWIEVDGGINEETIGEVRQAGADLFVTGSAVYNERQTVAQAVAALRSSLAGADSTTTDQ